MDEHTGLILALIEAFVFALTGYFLQFLVGEVLTAIIVFPIWGFVCYKTFDKFF